MHLVRIWSLTTGADVVSGTAESDVINATQSTYNTIDVIIDSTTTDNDVLNLTTTSSITETPTVANIETINVTGSKVGALTFNMANISGAKTVTVDRTDVMDGAIDGTGSVSISSARAAEFVAGEKVSAFTVGMSATGNITTAAVVDATNATGTVTVTGIGFAGTTVNGIVDQNVSVAGTTAKATVNASGEVGVTNAVSQLTLNATDDAEFTVDAIGAAGTLTLEGASDVVINMAAAVLNTGVSAGATGGGLVNNNTGVTTINVTSDALLNLTKLDSVNSVVLDVAAGAGFTSQIIAKSDQLITSKNDSTLKIQNIADTSTGSARFAVLDNGVDAAVDIGTAVFGEVAGDDDFESVYLDATADKLSATSINANEAALVLTGTKDMALGTVTNATSIVSSSTGKITLISDGDGATGAFEQSIITGAGNDTVTVDNGTTLFVANLGNGNNTLTITDAKTESSFVTGEGNDKVTLTNAQGKVSVSTGAGDDTITLGALTNVTDLTINMGQGTTDVLSLTAGSASVLSGLTTSSFSGVDQIHLQDKGLTLSAAQFAQLNTVDLNGTASTSILQVNAAAAGSTIDASGLGYVFGATAETALVGGAGNDTITGSIGKDVMTGGTAGEDIFVFSSGSGNTTTIFDKITDFTKADDSIKTGVAGTASNFATGTGAADAAVALTAANTALDGIVQFYFASAIVDASGIGGAASGGGADGALFIDWNLDGTADQTILITGGISGFVEAGDIIV